MSHSVPCDKMRSSYEELYEMKQEIDRVDGLLMDMKEEISIRCNAIMCSTFPRIQRKTELQIELTRIFNPLKELMGLMERRLVQKKKKEGKGARERREKKKKSLERGRLSGRQKND